MPFLTLDDVSIFGDFLHVSLFASDHFRAAASEQERFQNWI